MTDKIVRVVPSTNLNPKRELTEEELNKYEMAYFDYVEGVGRKINERWPTISPEQHAVLIERMISPFVYWLQAEIGIEELAKRKG